MAQYGESEVTGNDAVAFFVEVVAIVLLGVWGFQLGSDTVDHLTLGLGVPAAATTLWALFAAPKCYYDHATTRLMVKVLVLGGSVLAAFVVLPLGWAVAFAVVVALNTALLYIGPFAR